METIHEPSVERRPTSQAAVPKRLGPERQRVAAAGAILILIVGAGLVQRRPASPAPEPAAPAPEASLGEGRPAGPAEPLVPLVAGDRAASPAEEALLPLLLEQSLAPGEVPPVQDPPRPEGPAVSLAKIVPEPLSSAFKLKDSLSGLFAYQGAAHDSLRKVALTRKREVWILAKLPPPAAAPPKRDSREEGPSAVAEGEIALRVDAPAANTAAPPPGRKRRVFRSSTRGSALSPYAGAGASFGAEAAATSAAESAAGAIQAAAPQALAQGPARPAPEPAPRRLSRPAEAAGPVLSEDRLRYMLDCGPSRKCGFEGYSRRVSREEYRQTFEQFRSMAKHLFTQQIVDLNDGGTVCRQAGMICRGPKGDYFPVADDATARHFGWPTEAEVLAAGGVIFPSPLVFDLDGDGVRSSERRVRFDLNGDGVLDRFTDISSKDGLLVFDSDRDGISGEHARELFGTATDLDGDGRPDGFKDGFAALRALVEKARRQGAIGAKPDGWLDADELSALESRYGLRMRVGSLGAKAVSLKDAGVARLRLSEAAPVVIKDFDGQGNDTMRQVGARFERRDGTHGDYEDLWFRATTPVDLLSRLPR